MTPAPAPMAPAPMTPAPAPMAPAPMTPAPAPMAPAPMTPAPAPMPPAQMNPAPAPMPPAPMAPDTTGTMSAAPMPSDSMSGSMAPGVIDYHILNNPFYNYVDLMQARNRGLTDSQIATIATVARASYMPFDTISRAVERGETFPMLATEYNLNLADVYANDKEKARIADYITAYESLNAKVGSGGMMGNINMSQPMAGGNDMSTEKPMDTDKPTSAPAMPTMDIVETAMAAKNLTTLVKALQLAGLVETLKGAGPFTVFAPDDRAFSKLPAGQLDALMADPAKLKTILTYHVIPASVDAATAMSMTSPTSPPTVEGATLQVTKGRRGKLMINDATVVKGDIHATNGIIHIINKVLMPPMDATMPAVPMTPATPAAPIDNTAPTAPAAPMTPATPAAPAPTAPPQ